jgi:hypothetical protein
MTDHLAPEEAPPKRIFEQHRQIEGPLLNRDGFTDAFQQFCRWFSSPDHSPGSALPFV